MANLKKAECFTQSFFLQIYKESREQGQDDCTDILLHVSGNLATGFDFKETFTDAFEVGQFEAANSSIGLNPTSFSPKICGVVKIDNLAKSLRPW